MPVLEQLCAVNTDIPWIFASFHLLTLACVPDSGLDGSGAVFMDGKDPKNPGLMGRGCWWPGPALPQGWARWAPPWHTHRAGVFIP